MLERPGAVAFAEQTGGRRDPRRASPALRRILVAPSALDGAVLLSREEAGRPMPRDGLPVAGFVGPGLYAVASHSGVTLGPLLGELVAGEISRGVRYDLLESFRPARFAETGR